MLWAVSGMALLTALALMPAGRAAAQSFTILRSFGFLNEVTGTRPRSTLVQGADGTLYGTTSLGEGNVIGTVFKVRPDGTGFTVLKRITPPPGASQPSGGPWVGLTLSGSTLYGTTSWSWSTNAGTVFSIKTDGTGYTVMHNFTGSSDDGSFPWALTLSGSTLYGTTLYGGTSNEGTVFKLNTDATGYTVMHNFTGSSDGARPSGGLTLSGSTLYGATCGDGNLSRGTVFSMNTDGTGYTVLGNFSDGVPQAGLTLSGSTLYGTTSGGGSARAGTVFKVSTDGTGYTVLYNFTNSPDGANPQAELTLSGNTLYGTTYGGGSSNSWGTVFKLNIDGTGYTVLYGFTGSADGGSPTAGLMLSGGTLYGTANQGGGSGDGTVFKLNTDGTGYTVLQSFTHSTDGVGPAPGLTQSGGTLYGTTYNGSGTTHNGSAGWGTVFKVNTDVTGYTVLYSFTFVAVVGDGAYPNGGLTLSGGTLYGTANQGGSFGFGTVFSINTDGTGFTVLEDFTVEGDPAAGLTLSGSTLYGTTDNSLAGYGTVFKLNTDGTGYTALHNFDGASDGAYPRTGLTLSGSTLYGTANGGGPSNGGTVFSINTDGTGYTVLHDFKGSPDGASPMAELTLSGSTLYGTTDLGGSSNSGTVFKLNPDGTGYTVLHNFAGASDGAYPNGGLTLWGSTLYGATFHGGSSGYGTLFKLNTDGTGYAVVKSFTGPPDGAYPLGGLILSGTTLYGTTSGGGDLDEGTVFSLNLAPLLNITTTSGAVVLSWADPAFGLQAAPEAAGVYSNVPGATSPYASPITGGRRFFRLAPP